MSPRADDRMMDVAMGLGAPDDPVDVSVILPAYNEEESIEGIYEQMTQTLECAGYSYEILFVDDGSTDGTWKKLELVASSDPRVRVIRHRRNFGKASALANGFAYARGDIMVTSDADMQYDPKDVLRLIDKIYEGYDVVSAYKVVRRDPLSKRIPSWFFNFWVRNTTDVKLHDINAGLKAFRHDAAEDLIKYGYGELHRFFIVIAARRGYRVAEVPVESCYRTTGKSKYGAERYLRGAFDYLTVLFLSGYSERPLHFLGTVGLWCGGIGTIVCVGASVFALFADGSASFLLPPFVLGALLIFTGVQLMAFGLIAEMINNLERANSGRSKIAEVVRVERRSAVVLSPGVQVERRQNLSRHAANAHGPVPPDVQDIAASAHAVPGAPKEATDSERTAAS